MNLQLFADGGDGTGQGTNTQTGAGGNDANKGGNAGSGNTGNEPKTFTQEDLDRIINERLAREREKYKDYNELKKAAEELKKIKESQMSEAEKLQAKLVEYERAMADKELELATLRAEQIKTKVLTEMGLPLSWASRIFGTTEEEIKADAEELKKLLGIQGKPIGGGTNPPGSGSPTFTREQIERMSPDEINKNWDIISKLMAEGKLK
ncbi:capsid assembly scaffolding protein Gp46 family protein [Thermoanaerobacterium sp. DL9XJH110]|uniref:capsid assembly scaffolding protein Gp46 family protein n=1 Tax=Thermoanaerobacterium sp. DL9XJH110 TaxID=3386643 RepID=UPI003BB591E7